MQKEHFELTIQLNASAEQIYSDWLDSKGHTEMTGGEAEASTEPGFEFSAWDGYISGKNIELEPNVRIVQSWRTVEFDDSWEDSHLEVLFDSVGENQTKVTLKHSNLAPGDGVKYSDGWKAHYFEPMSAYYGE